MARRYPLSILILMTLLGAACWVSQLPVSAQSAGRLQLSPPEVASYPKIHLYLDAHDASGNFLHGLTASDLKIIENGNPVRADEVVEIHPGVQFVLAFSPGHSLSIRDGMGSSRLDYLILGLSAWAWDLQALGNDDLSMITIDGPEVVHFSDPATLIDNLKAYHPNLRNTEPDLAPLSRALQIAEDALPRPGMERAVLFITPLQPAEAAAGLQSLAARASQIGVRIFIWLVATPDTAASTEALQLSQLADQTGGAMFTFTGTEGIPDIETYLEPLRHIYSLAYTCSLNTSGTFPLQAEATFSGQVLTSNVQEINLNIQPPNPIFLSLTPEISRSVLEPGSLRTTSQAESLQEWTVDEKTIEVFVEFPDGHSRQVVKSSLYIDGALAQTNSSPPYEKFTWDLRPYTESGSHTLQVEVTDSLGLSGRSLEMPVQITVEQPDLSFKLIFSGRNLWFVFVLLLLAGFILILVLILGGRIQPRQPGKTVPARARASRLATDPVTQPVKAREEAPARSPSHRTLRLPRSQPRHSVQSFASLTPILQAEGAHQDAPLPIHTDVVIFGRDPLQATWVIEDETTEALHARLIREGNTYRLVDANTTAGTWINYAPVPPGGALLEHGDMIHLGGVCFRFSLRSPGKIRKPVIVNQEQRF